MRKCSHILFCSCLAVIILVAGVGVDITRCSCSGHVTLTVGNSSGTDDCGTDNGCMTTTHLQLPATVIQGGNSFDFQVQQPIALVLDFLPWRTALNPLMRVHRWQCSFRGPPPRVYLQLLTVLLI